MKGTLPTFAFPFVLGFFILHLSFVPLSLRYYLIILLLVFTIIYLVMLVISPEHVCCSKPLLFSREDNRMKIKHRLVLVSHRDQKESTFLYRYPL